MSQLVERKGFKIESTLPTKKKKEKKPKTKPVENVHIIDDDAAVPWNITTTTTTRETDTTANDELVSVEDAPVIVGVIDERPKEIREKERFQNMKRWRPAAFEEIPEPDIIGPQLKPTKSSNQKQNQDDDSDPDIDRRRTQTNDNSDSSPPRRRTQKNDVDDDPSPPRRRRQVDDDPSPPRRKNQTKNDDSSPPRRRDTSPSRRQKNDDSSPPRRKYQTNDDDASPPRKRDTSPPRRRKHDDSSPPRRRDSSPPRRKHKHKDDSSPLRRRDTSSSPPPRKRQTRGEDTSPPRRRDKSSSSTSTQRRQPKEEPSSPPLHHRLKKESSPPSAQPAKSERRRLAEHKEKVAERYAQWGRGVAQVRQQEEAVKDYLEEAAKPLARYRNDQDLDVLLKQSEREDDPMLKYLTNKPSDSGDRTSNSNQASAKPRYRGPEPQKNRFDIWPGYRWDGVDRSNGYERKLFESIASRHAKAQEAYLWSVEDM